MTKIDVQKMMEAMRPQLERDESEDRLAGLSVDDLAEAVSVQEGEPAPDFTLPWLDKSGAGRGAALTLSDHFGKRPVALIFGSYT